MESFLVGVLKIILAIGLASIVGMEREKSGKPVGVRTLALVCAGSAFLTTVSLGIPSLDSGKIIGGIVTGIGFLGAGTIISHKSNISGITTAATVWVIAILGIGIGLGEYVLSIVATGIIYFVLREGVITKKILGDKTSENNSKSKRLYN